MDELVNCMPRIKHHQKIALLRFVSTPINIIISYSPNTFINA